MRNIDKKLMVKSIYEMLLAWPHVEGTNKLSKTRNCVKKKQQVSLYFRKNKYTQ